MTGKIIGVLSVGVALLAGFGWRDSLGTDNARSDLSPSQGIYVWNRTWNGAVQSGFHEASNRCKDFWVLAGQAGEDDEGIGWTRVGIDYPTIAARVESIALVFRIGRMSRPIDSDRELTNRLGELIHEEIAEASRTGLRVREVQVDYDCPENRLSEYARFLRNLKKQTSDIDLTFTSLPSWLDQPDIDDLLEEVDEYVLQLHCLDLPKSMESEGAIFDPAEARRYVSMASDLGKAYRIALPTYAYRVFFDEAGDRVGVFAENSMDDTPIGVQTRDLRTDPHEILEFLTWLRDSPPLHASGILWFRMPTPRDRFNWTWSTLEAVMEGRVPEGRLEALVTMSDPHLGDIELVNSGDAEIELESHLQISWENNRLVAVDSLRGFKSTRKQSHSIEFQSNQGPRIRLRPGERRSVGWVRLEEPGVIHARIVPEG